MGLEAVMICIDNSEWSRNGDYAPSRFDGQNEAANLVAGQRTGSNPETGVGLLTMAGERAEIHLTPTTDLGAFISALSGMQIKGKSDFVRGVQSATLALKHRQNKNQKQRVICFVGSPVEATEKQLETLGKTLKKNNVSLDVVSFGEIADNHAKLQKLVDSCNEDSHLVEVELPKVLSDAILSSAICFGEGGAPGGAGAAAGGDGFEFGVDPSADPELALALRISMEESRRREEGAGGEPSGDAAAAPAGAATGSSGAAAPAAESAGAAATGAPGAAPAGVDIPGFEDMDEELRQAILLSMQGIVGATRTFSIAIAPKNAFFLHKVFPHFSISFPLFDDVLSNYKMQLPNFPPHKKCKLDPVIGISFPIESAPPPAAETPAAASSTKAEGEPAEKKQKTEPKADAPPAAAAAAPAEENLFQDPDFMASLLSELPGVDVNDARIQAAIKGDDADKKDGDKKDDKKDDKKK
ncbi:unnamed protein product [Amoebophrya sp. A25]|nr:unnamed protein product [Amoebophrya sp. A25]|eukprot:GSA25T00010363001.1